MAERAELEKRVSEDQARREDFESQMKTMKTQSLIKLLRRIRTMLKLAGLRTEAELRFLKSWLKQIR